MNALHLEGFCIVPHTHRLAKTGGSRVGYHCPECGCFYAEGNFTIENATHVLGDSERRKCCGKDRPTPHLFETLGEVRGFIAALEAEGTQQKATLIEKRSLAIAHFNQKFVVEQKRKTYH